MVAGDGVVDGEAVNSNHNVFRERTLDLLAFIVDTQVYSFLEWFIMEGLDHKLGVLDVEPVINVVIGSVTLQQILGVLVTE